MIFCTFTRERALRMRTDSLVFQLDIWLTPPPHVIMTSHFPKLFNGNHPGLLKLKMPPGILTYLHNVCLSRHSRPVPTLWFQAWDTWSTSATSSRRSASCRRRTSCCKWRFAACRRMVGRQRPKRCVTISLLIFLVMLLILKQAMALPSCRYT